MTDKTEAMDNLIAQDADLIEICPDDLVQRLREDVFYGDARLANMDKHNPLHMDAADCIEQLEREKAVVSDLWEQQKEIALDYLTDCNKAAEHIEAQAAEIEHLRAEAEAHYDRGYYDGSTHLLQPIQSAMADEIKQLRKEQEQSK
jgi:hypothetical protein